MKYISDLYTQNDFNNLTNRDINNFILKNNIDIDKNDDKREYLYRKKDTLDQNDDFKNMVSQKAFAGKVSIKWKKFVYTSDFTKDNLKTKLESVDNNYDASILVQWYKLLEEKELNEKTNKILSIKKCDNYYIIRIALNDGYKKISTGIGTRKELNIKIFTILTDIDNCWIEYRCPSSLISELEKVLKNDLGFDNIIETSILNKYNSNIEDFKKALFNGFRFSNAAIPLKDIELSSDEKQELFDIFSVIEKYREDHNEDDLLESFRKFQMTFQGVSILEALLSSIGMFSLDLQKDSENDLDDSLLYKMFRDKSQDNSSYIKFTIAEESKEYYTIRISLKEHSIFFTSSVTEDVIEYIRNKVI